MQRPPTGRPNTGGAAVHGGGAGQQPQVQRADAVAVPVARHVGGPQHGAHLLHHGGGPGTSLEMERIPYPCEYGNVCGVYVGRLLCVRGK